MNARLPLALPCHEDLSRLARDDPSAFEELRSSLIENLIASAPEKTKPRLRGIQFQVDCLRRLSSSALGATVRIYELMWKSFLDLNYNCQDLVQMERHRLAGKQVSTDSESPPPSKAQVIEFRALPASGSLPDRGK